MLHFKIVCLYIGIKYFSWLLKVTNECQLKEHSDTAQFRLFSFQRIGQKIYPRRSGIPRNRPCDASLLTIYYLKIKVQMKIKRTLLQFIFRLWFLHSYICLWFPAIVLHFLSHPVEIMSHPVVHSWLARVTERRRLRSGYYPWCGTQHMPV